MRIKWFAHAAFLLEGDGLRIITDPYTPELMGFAPITEPADLVIRSSADDKGHCYAEMIPGNPRVVTATEILEDGVTVRGCRISAVATQESLIHKDSPLDNAMYRFTLEGIRIAHFGDVGNRLTAEQIAALGGVDLVLVPTGGPPTIDLEDLMEAIRVLRPRMIIPMHYALPGCNFPMLEVAEFARGFPVDSVSWLKATEMEVNSSQLPAETKVFIFEPSTAGGHIT